MASNNDYSELSLKLLPYSSTIIYEIYAGFGSYRSQQYTTYTHTNLWAG